MKAFPLAMAASMALAGAALAGGIQGRVANEDGSPRAGATVSVKGYHQSTTTDANGYYTLRMPPQVGGARVNVYINGAFAVNCLVPPGDANSTVEITMVRR